MGYKNNAIYFRIFAGLLALGWGSGNAPEANPLGPVAVEWRLSAGVEPGTLLLEIDFRPTQDFSVLRWNLEGDFSLTSGATNGDIAGVSGQTSKSKFVLRPNRAAGNATLRVNGRLANGKPAGGVYMIALRAAPDDIPEDYSVESPAEKRRAPANGGGIKTLPGREEAW